MGGEAELKRESVRTSYWRGLHAEIRLAKEASEVAARDYHVDRAGEYADLLAETADGMDEPRSSGYFLECALGDTDDRAWTLAL